MRLLAAAVLLALIAQTQPPPRFRTGIDVVELDVTVVDRHRRPIRGLTAADFTLLEDGRPQEVVAFQEVDVPGHDVTGAGWLREVAPDVASNEPAGGRILIVVLDDATMPVNPMTLRTAKEIAREAIAGLGPQDRAAVLFTRDNSNSQDFTGDRARLARAVEKLSPGFVRPSGDAVGRGGVGSPRRSSQAPASREDALFYHYSIQTVRRAAEFLRDAPHRRKTLLYISVGVPIDFAPGATEGTVSSPDGDVQRDLAYQAQRAFAEAVRSNVVIYGIDPAGLQVDDTRLTREFLQTISENTGGSAVFNTNAPAAEVASILDESGSYYLLGFQSSNQQKDGRFRRLEVRVNRPGVTIRARRGYYAPRAGRDDPKRAADSGSGVDAAIGGLLPKGDLPMHVVVTPFAISGKRDASLAIVTQLELVPSPEPGPQTLDVLTGLFDTEGRPKGGTRQTVTLKSANRTSSSSKYEVLSKVDVKPGHYLVRIGAHNPSAGTSGSVYTDVDVPDFSRADLALSGVAVSAADARSPEPQEALASLIPVVPTARREFARSETVTAFMRVHQGRRKSAAPVAMATRILDAADRQVFGRTETLAPESFSAERALDYTLELPLADLSPGLHVLIIEARSGKAAARRDVRFTVR